MQSSPRHKSKGDILLTVLARLAEGIGDAASLFGAFVEAGYGASHRKMQYVARRNRAEASRIAHVSPLAREAKRKYQLLLSALKRDGLVEERSKKFGRAFMITRKGIEKLMALRKRKKNMLPPIAYGSEKSDVVTIVTFDIPERERRKRSWLRAALKRLEFTLAQKSVWVGKVKIPRSFLDDLRILQITEFVEIFQITKTGSLKHIA